MGAASLPFEILSVADRVDVMAQRFFVEFDEQLSTPVTSQLGGRALWQARSPVAEVAGLILQIHEDFAIPASQSLRIAVHGFTVPPGSLVSLLRDNDRLQVFPAEARPAVLPAAHEQQQALQLTAAPAAARDAALASQSRPRAKRGRPDPAGPIAPQYDAPAVSEWRRAAEPSADAAEATLVHDVQQPLENGPAVTSSDESESEAKKTPSRSARRKKLKRQLRREGVLPSARSSRARDQREAGRGAVSDEATNGLHQQQQQLPKRGEAWAMSQAQRRFASQGHVYFSDSEGEQRPGSKRARAAPNEQPAGASMPSVGARLVAVGVREGLHGGAAAAAAKGPKDPLGEEAANKGPADQHAAEAPAAASTRPSGQLQHSGELLSVGPSCDAQFEALPRLQLPSQGDVIGYRLLHIGADWTPQVSEWRKGKVSDWQESTQMLTVQPWPDPSVHPLSGPPRAQQLVADGEAEDEEEEEEGPPSDYDEEGTLVATLQSFHDLRRISAGRGDNPPAAPGDAHGNSAAPDIATAPSAACINKGQEQFAEQPPPAAGQPEQGRSRLPNGSSSHAAAPAEHSVAPFAAPSAMYTPKAGPPTPGGAVIPPVGAWMSVAEQLRRRRAELAAQRQGTLSPAAHAAGAALPMSSDGRAAGLNGSAGGAAQQPQRSSRGALPQKAAAEPQEPSGPSHVAAGKGADAASSGAGPGSSVNTPGAVKPPPGVRASSVGLFLARLRAQDAHDDAQ